MIGSNEGGNERYTKNLFLSLAKNRKERIYLLVGKLGKKMPEKKIIFRKDADRNLFRLFYLLPWLIKVNKVDILHSNYISPFFKNAQYVITLHDMSFKYFPEYFSFRERLIFRYLLPYSLWLSDAVIVPSEFTKKEFLKFYPKYSKKTSVVNYAAEGIFRKIPRKLAQASRNTLLESEKPFLLAINSKNPRKNINRIIQAYLLIQKKFPGLELVIVGGNFNIDRKYLDNQKIKVLKNVNDDELNSLYNAASIFIYFSVYEGFGLPILEALKCKTLVICSDIEVHREIAKDFVTFANPYKAEDLAGKIELLLKNKAYAEKMRINSSKINKLYSWSKTAKETFKVYTFLDKK